VQNEAARTVTHHAFDCVCDNRSAHSTASMLWCLMLSPYNHLHSLYVTPPHLIPSGAKCDVAGSCRQEASSAGAEIQHHPAEATGAAASSATGSLAKVSHIAPTMLASLFFQSAKQSLGQSCKTHGTATTLEADMPAAHSCGDVPVPSLSAFLPSSRCQIWQQLQSGTPALAKLWQTLSSHLLCIDMVGPA